MEHIVHGIPPTYDEHSRVLVLGSLPSPKSREMGFNYGHPRNRFWQVMARLADEPVPATVDRKRDFCLRHHIALWDVVAECDIEGASDASIRNPVPNDLARIVEYAPIEAVFCTGAKAHELYGKLGCEKSCGLPAVKLPSTSPANAQASLDDLTAAYARIFEHVCEFEAPAMDVDDVRELEQEIAEDGTPLGELMDRAGGAVAFRVEAILDELSAGTYPASAKAGIPAADPLITILCGSGNNGGDGWVAAELLAEKGIDVCLVSAKDPDELRAQPARDAAFRSMAALEGAGGTRVEGDGAVPVDGDGRMTRFPLMLIRPGSAALEAVMERTTVLVDAILGIGFNGGPVKEPYASWIESARRTEDGHVTLAVDVPSGLDAQTGASQQAIRADETVTMIVAKPGLGAPECGRVRVASVVYIEPYLENR